MEARINKNIEELINQEEARVLKRAEMGEAGAGVEKGFIELCENIIDYFDDDDATLTIFLDSLVEGQGHVMFNVVSGTQGRAPLYEECQKVECLTLEDWEDILHESKWIPRNVSFAVGFCLGQMVDITDPELCGNLRAVRKAIVEKQLLPYLPREKQARGM